MPTIFPYFSMWAVPTLLAGFIGCIQADENLSTNYKPIVQDTIKSSQHEAKL